MCATKERPQRKLAGPFFSLSFSLSHRDALSDENSSSVSSPSLTRSKTSNRRSTSSSEMYWLCLAFRSLRWKSAFDTVNPLPTEVFSCSAEYPKWEAGLSKLGSKWIDLPCNRGRPYQIKLYLTSQFLSTVVQFAFASFVHSKSWEKKVPNQRQ